MVSTTLVVDATRLMPPVRGENATCVVPCTSRVNVYRRSDKFVDQGQVIEREVS